MTIVTYKKCPSHTDVTKYAYTDKDFFYVSSCTLLYILPHHEILRLLLQHKRFAPSLFPIVYELILSPSKTLDEIFSHDVPLFLETNNLFFSRNLFPWAIVNLLLSVYLLCAGAVLRRYFEALIVSYIPS